MTSLPTFTTTAAGTKIYDRAFDWKVTGASGLVRYIKARSEYQALSLFEEEYETPISAIEDPE